jgi:poly-gamma-glutamate capsule biosynthesis protein CapA/YwtB (metallophosphatase superfamily)
LSRIPTTLALGVALGIACSRSPELRPNDGRPAPDDLPIHTLMYTGDLLVGRRVNEALHQAKSRRRLLGAVAEAMSAPDITLVNAEGVISGGGAFADKGESRPYMYRAHPVAIEVLQQIGVDVVTAGNNHSGDYGPLALQEMLDRLQHAGIAYTGVGYNRADAATPAYVRVGDTVVAFVGADLTIAKRFRATEDAAGSLWLPGLQRPRIDQVVLELRAIQRAARKHAHLVVLTPHWGDNFRSAPSPHIRKLGRMLIRKAGYDAILGHSAHELQGVELVDGKPIVYDAGNLLLDFNGHRGKVGQSMLFVAEFTQAGVTKVSGTPIIMKKNRTLFAKGERKQKILDRWQGQSAALGSVVTIEDGKAVIRCDPRGIRGPQDAPEPPARTPPAEIRPAPQDLILDALPEAAEPAAVQWPGGVKMIGSAVFPSERLSLPKAGAFVDLYLTTSAVPTKAYTILLKTLDKKGRRIRQDHLPGDWLLPATRWPTGRIIHDRTLFRLTYKKASGEVVFLAALSEDGKTPLPPTKSDRELIDDFVVLGRRTYVKGAPRLFEEWRRTHGGD